MSAEQQRLLQALEHFTNRTKGGDLPKGTEEALQALQKALSGPMPGNDSPGQREALSVAPGTTGTGEHFSKAALGVDGPSPGQGESKSLSQQIADAAAEISQHAAK